MFTNSIPFTSRKANARKDQRSGIVGSEMRLGKDSSCSWAGVEMNRAEEVGRRREAEDSISAAHNSTMRWVRVLIHTLLYGYNDNLLLGRGAS